MSGHPEDMGDIRIRRMEEAPVVKAATIQTAVGSPKPAALVGMEVYQGAQGYWYWKSDGMLVLVDNGYLIPEKNAKAPINDTSPLRRHATLGPVFQPPKGINPKDMHAHKKLPLGLVPSIINVIMAKVMHFGGFLAGPQGKGYGPYNWRTSQQVSLNVYLDAIERHLIRLRAGEDFAADSGCEHVGHIASNCAIIADAMYGGYLVDDRPKGGTHVLAAMDAFPPKRLSPS